VLPHSKQAVAAYVSKMGIIKSVLRSTIGKQRLNMLSLMSIERDVKRADDWRYCSNESSQGFAADAA